MWFKLCSFLVGTILFVFLDQVTKQLAVQYLKNAPAVPILPEIFELSYLENHGAAFGILQGQKMFLVIITGLTMALLIYAYFCIPEKKRYASLHLLLILIVSGAVGNFIDRCANDYVVDFFYFKLIDFPVFNVADIYVTVSTCLLIVLFCFYYNEEDVNLMYGRLLFWKKKEDL